jgi:hypothetical protein
MLDHVNEMDNFFQNMNEIIQLQKSDEVELFLTQLENYIGTDVLDFDVDIRNYFTGVKTYIISCKPFIRSNQLSETQKNVITDLMIKILGLKYAFTLLEGFVP